MLVLSRRLNEKLVFPSIPATIQVVTIKPGAVRLGIDAPPEVTVLREEVRDRSAQWQATNPAQHEVEPPARLSRLLRDRLRITASGLALLRRQLEIGRRDDAALTLDKLEEELQMLRERLEAEEKQPLPPLRERKPRTALLVEDNPNERELMALFLRSAGLNVATAGDGSDALDYLHHRGRPDVVLLDMGLPRFDGPSTVRAIRNDPAYKGLKIFAVTGHRREEFDLDVGPGGVDRWFYKPIDPAELLHDVHEELDRTTCAVG
jgi:carbon storage regulator CsrA